MSRGITWATKKRRDRWTKLLARWQAVPVGSCVMLELDDGTKVATRTRSEPWTLGHGQPVILVEGKTGGWMLERLSLAEQDEEERC